MLERQPAAEEHTDPRYDISRPIWFLYNFLLLIPSWFISGMNNPWYLIQKSQISKLRTYTPRFARALLEMIPTMTSEHHIWNRTVP